ncbi:MAG: hypothetical protein ACIAS6_03155 [Phycisphaerales bacterium JB060]
MKPSNPCPRALLVLPLLALRALLALPACEEAAIEERAVPEGAETIAEPPQTQTQTQTEPAAAAEAADGQPAFAEDAEAWPWAAPAGWRRVDQERPMRLATYVIESGDAGDAVEVAISRFPGDVGGMLANVNRWRGQVGLAPVASGELDGMMERFENPGFVGHTMRLEGPEGHMLVASIHEAAQDRTWFVRVTTDAAAADAVQDEVFAFARTFGAGG